MENMSGLLEAEAADDPLWTEWEAGMACVS